MYKPVRRFALILPMILTVALLLPNVVASAAAPEEFQQTGTTKPVYALPGVFRAAVNQPYDTEMVVSNGDVYAIVGETPAVETQIDAARDATPPAQVKVWGTLYPDGRMTKTPEIVVSSIQTANSAPAATATAVSTQPQATITTAVLNVRSGTSTLYPVIAELTQGQTCFITARDTTGTWWQLHCANDVVGWVDGTYTTVTGSTANVPIVTAPPPPPTTTPAPQPTPVPQPTAAPANPNVTNGWYVNYWNNTSMSGSASVVRNEARDRYPLDRNWGAGSPVPGVINVDNFSARWVGSYHFDPGDYLFKADSDDGVRVYIDGQRVIDAWSDGQRSTQNTFHGVGGGQHQITVEYYEHTGNASIRVYWQKTSDGGGSGGSGGGDGSGPGGGLDE